MVRKRWFWLFMVVLAFLVGIWGVFFFTQNENFGKLVQPKNSYSSTRPDNSVISWQPDLATLTYISQGQPTTIEIKPLKPLVIVPIFENGQLIKEELALSPRSAYWQTAFCPDDLLELKATASGEIITIRNKGPRSCAN